MWTLSALPIPKWWVSILIPYGMLSSALHFLRQLGRRAAAGASRSRRMTWWVALSGGVTLLIALFMLGVPIFVAFVVLNVVGVFVLFGAAGFGLFANSIYSTATMGALSAVPLFIVMGEILFRSGAMDVLFDSLDRLIGRIRGRQYVLCIVLSAILGALSGAAMAVAGLLGRSLFPDHAQARLRHAVLRRHDPGRREPRSDHSAERARSHHRGARRRIRRQDAGRRHPAGPAADRHVPGLCAGPRAHHARRSPPTSPSTSAARRAAQ